MAILTSNELRNGKVFMMDGAPWVVIKFDHIKMGRGGATNKVKAKNLKTGAIIEKGFTTNVKFEEADVAKTSAQYLYVDTENAYFMNPESFEQYEVSLELCKDDILYLKEGDKVVLVMLDESPISLELPKTVEHKIVYTEDAIRGNTSGNAMKFAETETGLRIKVPIFVKNGETVKISTENGEYSERIKK